jgi:hypothetical protein
MGIFQKIVGITGDLFTLGNDGTAHSVKNHADGVQMVDPDGTTLANAVIKRAASDDHAAAYLDVKERCFDIEFSFPGGTPPSGNTGKYGICHTDGGIYTAGQIYLDVTGTPPLTAVTVYKGAILTTRDAVTGTVNLITNGVYVAQSGSGNYTWTLKGDGAASDTGYVKTISVPFTNATIGTPVSSGAIIPVGAKIVRVMVNVTVAFTGGAAPTCLAVVYNVGGVTNLSLTTDSALGVASQYDVLDLVTVATSRSGPVKVTIGGTATAGAGEVLVQYVLPLT